MANAILTKWRARLTKIFSFFRHYCSLSSAVLCLTIGREDKIGRKPQACMTSIDENRSLNIRVKKNKIGPLL